MKSGGRINRRADKRDESHVMKGLAAGLFGGLVASWTMNQFQALLSKLSEKDKKSQSEKSAQQGGGQEEQKKSQDESKEGDDATIKAASA
nr:hypothetical protein [Pyrinomonadaceae bacterium]